MPETGMSFPTINSGASFPPCLPLDLGTDNLLRCCCWPQWAENRGNGWRCGFLLMVDRMTGKYLRRVLMEGAYSEKLKWGKRAQWTKRAAQKVRVRGKPRELRGAWATEAHTSTSGSLAGPEKSWVGESSPLAGSSSLVSLSKVINSKTLKSNRHKETQKGEKRGWCAKVKEHLFLLANAISTPLCVNTPAIAQAPDVGRCADSFLSSHREAHQGVLQARPFPSS